MSEKVRLSATLSAEEAAEVIREATAIQNAGAATLSREEIVAMGT